MAIKTYEEKVRSTFKELLNNEKFEEHEREMIKCLLDQIINLSIRQERGESITADLNSKVNTFIDKVKRDAD